MNHKNGGSNHSTTTGSCSSSHINSRTYDSTNTISTMVTTGSCDSQSSTDSLLLLAHHHQQQQQQHIPYDSFNNYNHTTCHNNNNNNNDNSDNNDVRTRIALHHTGNNLHNNNDYNDTLYHHSHCQINDINDNINLYRTPPPLRPLSLAPTDAVVEVLQQQQQQQQQYQDLNDDSTTTTTTTTTNSSPSSSIRSHRRMISDATSSHDDHDDDDGRNNTTATATFTDQQSPVCETQTTTGTVHYHHNRIRFGAGQLLRSFQHHHQRIRYRRRRRLAEYEAAIMKRSNDHMMQYPTSAVRSRYIIPADHPLKLLWDFGTVLVSCIHAYKTHTSIRDRTFDIPYTNTIQICLELWFILDIVLNFITEHRLGTVTLRTVSAISARYLTTWFVIDVLSLIPGEWLFVRPVIQRLKARGWVQKWLSRTKAITRVTTKLVHRWTILRQVSGAYRRQMGIGGVARLVRTCIRYIPKYIMFLRNMKAVVAVRILRQWHWMRKVYYNIFVAIEVVNNNNYNNNTPPHPPLAETSSVLQSPNISKLSHSRSPLIMIRKSSDRHYDRRSDDNDRDTYTSIATPTDVATLLSVDTTTSNVTGTTRTLVKEAAAMIADPDGSNNFIRLEDDDSDNVLDDDEDAFESTSRVVLFQEFDDDDDDDDDNDDINNQDMDNPDDSYFFEDDNDGDDDGDPY